MKINAKINDLSLDSFKAKLLSYQTGDSSYNNGYILPPSSIWPVVLKAKRGLKTVTLSLDFSGNSRYEIEIAISNMKAILQQGADILLPDGFFYYSVYESCSATKEVAPWLVNVQFSLSSIRHGAMITEKLSKSETIFIEGNSETPAIFIMNSSDKEATVNDITINNIKNTVIIDGIEKTVTENGVNKFAETNLTAFPLLKCGLNSIYLSKNTTLEINYYPIYL